MKITVITFAAAAMLVVGSVGTAAAAGGPDLARGKTVFARCVACHDLNTGATRLGPSLKGVMGRKAGAMANFTYSPALKAKAVTWNAQTLDAYLTSPTKYIPGTRMPFAGLPDAKDRADLIAYLAQAAR